MADLPVVNALEELKESNKDDRQRLQKSLRAGLLNVVKSIEGLNATLTAGLDLQKAQMEIDERLRLAEIEAAREAARKKESESKEKVSKPDEEGFGILGWAAVIAGIGSALTAFAGSFVTAFTNTLRSFAKAFTPNFLKSFDDFRKAIRTGFQTLSTNVRTVFQTLKANVADDLARLGQSLRGVFGSFKDTKIFQVIKTLFIDPFKGIMRNIRAIGDILKPIIKGAESTQKMVGTIGRFFGSFTRVFSGLQPVINIAGRLGAILGRVFAPLTFIMGIWEAVTGAFEGFQNTQGDFVDKIIGGLQGAITGLVDFLIAAPLDLVKSLISWIAGKLGFENAEATLDQFSFSELFSNIIGSIFDGVRGVKDFIVSLFTFPDDATFLENIGLTAAGIFDVITYPINLAVNFIKGMFGLTNEELGGDEPFRFSTFITDIIEQTWEKIKDIFSSILDFDFGSLVPDWVKDALGLEDEAELNPIEQRNRRIAELQRTIDEGTGITNWSLDDEREEIARLRAQNTADLMRMERGRPLSDGTEVDIRSRELAGASSTQVITVAPQTNTNVNQSTSMNSTTVAPVSPQRVRPSPQPREGWGWF